MRFDAEAYWEFWVREVDRPRAAEHLAVQAKAKQLWWKFTKRQNRFEKAHRKAAYGT
jgi:hypothetical protein